MTAVCARRVTIYGSTKEIFSRVLWLICKCGSISELITTARCKICTVGYTDDVATPKMHLYTNYQHRNILNVYTIFWNHALKLIKIDHFKKLYHWFKLKFGYRLFGVLSNNITFKVIEKV